MLVLLVKQPGSQRTAILRIHLIEALGPPQTLIPGLLEGDRLLVVEDSGVAVADPLTLEGTVCRELNILGEQMIGPAAVLLYHFRRDQESGARNGTVGTR